MVKVDNIIPLLRFVIPNKFYRVKNNWISLTQIVCFGLNNQFVNNLLLLKKNYVKKNLLQYL